MQNTITGDISHLEDGFNVVVSRLQGSIDDIKKQLGVVHPDLGKDRIRGSMHHPSSESTRNFFMPVFLGNESPGHTPMHSIMSSPIKLEGVTRSSSSGGFTFKSPPGSGLKPQPLFKTQRGLGGHSPLAAGGSRRSSVSSHYSTVSSFSTSSKRSFKTGVSNSAKSAISNALEVSSLHS